MKVKSGRNVSRRQFLQSAGLAGAGGGLAAELLRSSEQETEAAHASAPAGQALKAGDIAVVLQVNGKRVAVTVEPRTTLISALRDRAEPAISGPKLVCDEAACGGCTVMLDGKTAYACMILAVDAVGRHITTVEGLAPDGELSEVQKAFVAKDGLMCGFCTPGFVTSVTALLRHNPSPTLEEVKAACAGNICRCGTYPRVFEAALAAARGRA